RRFRNQMELFREANVPLFTELAKLSTGWAKAIGAMTVDWDGEEKTPPQMVPYLESNDRSVRERAFRSMFKPYIEQRDTLADFFANVNEDFRGYFRRMADAGLLDLDNRKGKAPGGFCDSLPARKMPLIFMNAVDVDDDVQTLLHESGHCFHVFEAANLPLLFQRHPGAEMAEVASMSMELLAAPYIDRGHCGYYSDADAPRSRRAVLEGAVLFFTHCAS